MKISLKWLATLFKDPVTLEELQELRSSLTLRGLEVGSVENPAEAIRDVVVAEVIQADKHPNADKLKVCLVNWGEDRDSLQIVCGAKNARAGLKVALAPVGSVLPGDFKIKKAKIRGVESSGMLCSASELGLAEDSEGIMELPQSYRVGESLVDSMRLNDCVWDVDLTPDRGDCLSHYGIAREVSALLQKETTLPPHEQLNAEESSDVPLFTVEVLSPKACPHYSALLLEGIENREATDSTRRALESVGLRSHSAVVDTTNFVLMELGHPLHAFDADKIVGSKLIVRFANKGESITTLDGEKRKLSTEDLIIADLEKPVAIAGVMGSLDSAVDAKSKRVLLESAVFDPLLVRKSAQRHKIHSDASHRFERGVDRNMLRVAAGRCVKLLIEGTGARRRGSFIEVLDKKNEKYFDKRVLNLDLREFKSVIGIEVSAAHIKLLLESVDIDVQIKSPNVLTIEIPFHRNDLERQIDLIEEVARLVGFGKIPSRYPKQKTRSLAGSFHLYQKLQLIRSKLLETGLTEMMPYSFVSQEDVKSLPHHEAVPVGNPLSAEWSHMRPGLSFGLLKLLKNQAALGQMQGRFFDFGTAFSRDKKRGEYPTFTKESIHAAWALMGESWPAHWSTDKSSKDRKTQVDYYDSKGVAEHLFLHLQPLNPRWASTKVIALWEALEDKKFKEALEKEATWIPVSLLHPGRSALFYWPSKSSVNVLGFAGELHPLIQSSRLNLASGLQLGVSLGEIRIMDNLLDEIHESIKKQGAPLIEPNTMVKSSLRFPVVERDLAFVFDEKDRVEDIARTLKKAAGENLLELRCVDLYPLEGGKRSLSFRFYFQAKDKTLSDDEIKSDLKKIEKQVAKSFAATFREG